MGTSPTLSSSGRRSKMDFKDQSTSNNWISLINTVFASIAVLPVFLVWFLGIITDSIEEKENQDDRIIIVEDNDNEESEKSQEEIADRHLYIIPNLRSDSNLLEYKNYCTYQDFQTTPVHEELKQIHVIWDNFSSKSRPGLPQEDSSPDQSPSPRSRKPLKKINLEKESKLENKLKQRKYWNNAKSQNNILVRAF